MLSKAQRQHQDVRLLF